MNRHLTASIIAIFVLVFCMTASCYAESATYTPDEVVAILNDTMPEDADEKDTEYYCSTDSTGFSFYVYCVSNSIIEIANAASDGYKLATWEEIKANAYRKYVIIRETVDACGYDKSIVLFMYGRFTGEEKVATQISSYYCVSDIDGRDAVAVTDRITKNTDPVITAVAVADKPVDDDEIVYVWVSGSGKKYHSSSACSNMENPAEVTLKKAISMGLEPCSKCNAPR